MVSENKNPVLAFYGLIVLLSRTCIVASVLNSESKSFSSSFFWSTAEAQAQDSSKFAPVASDKMLAEVASRHKITTLGHKAFRNHVTRGFAGDAVLFLLKVVALETTRRISKTRCPFAWHSLQACQMLCYPPFKWVQRWAPFKGLVQGMQMLSRPLLVLSIASAFSDKSDKTCASGDNVSPSSDQLDLDSSSVQTYGDARVLNESPNRPSLEDWLLKVYEELEKQEIRLPERINRSELQRFFAAANGDLPCLISSIKKTIRWRETYKILSEDELKLWSKLVFWHGYDVRDRPCLIVRLGVACTSLPNHDRPRIAQAIVSQMEHGILHLADCEDPRIVVLVDCEGLSPFRLPMQMIRSCSLLFQDHFPNCLGGLYVIRLPPVVRMMVQTFMKVLKPVTRQKLNFLGERYMEDLSEYFQELPVCLGGKCICATCLNASSNNYRSFGSVEMANDTQLIADRFNREVIDFDYLSSELNDHHNFDQLLRTGVIGILVLCVFVAFLAGIFEPEEFVP